MSSGMSQREAARRFGSIRRRWPRCCGTAVSPGYRRTKAPTRPRLDAFTAIIDQILISTGRRRRSNGIRPSGSMIGCGPSTASWAATRPSRTTARSSGPRHPEFVPLVHPPGHAQADFGEKVAVIGGERRKVHLFCLDLPHSDACFVKAYPAERTEAFLDGHNAAFAFLGGVPRSDPLRQHQAGGGPDPGRRRAGSGPAPLPSCSRTICSSTASAGPAKATTRARSRAWSAMPGATSWSRSRRWRVSPSPTPGSSSTALTGCPIGFGVTSRALASGWSATWPPCSRGHLYPRRLRPPAGNGPSLALVRYERNDYSVPTAYGHRPVRVQGYVEEVVIACGAEIIARHKRSYAREDFVFDPLHYLDAAGTEDRRARPSCPAAGLGPARGVRNPTPPARQPCMPSARQRGVRPGSAPARKRPSGSRRARRGAPGAPAGDDRLRRREAPGLVPDRAPAAEAGPDGLSLSAARRRRDHLGRSLHGPLGRAA